jgi:GH15 family glucan-1,4-alpha-glucosidase
LADHLRWPANTADDFRFPPHVLREYALLADGERGALIGPRGDLSWLCAPGWDGPAVFSSLIGGGGLYAVTPANPRFVWGGFYEPGGLIWRSRWVSTTGVTECREALAFPADPHTIVVLRRVIAHDGPAVIDVVLDPRADFGRQPMRDLRHHGDEFNGRCGGLYLRWTGAVAARRRRESLTMHLEVAEGQHHDLILELSDRPLGAERPDPDRLWETTEAAWGRAVPKLDHTVAERDAGHALAVLSGLTSQGGGMVAAATMSLPERAGAGRNYDYRYAWIRDQCYAGQAAAAAGTTTLLDAAVTFMTERLLDDGAQMKPAYRVTGAPVPNEQRLTHLSGYPGGTDKIGNWVNQQFQLDAFGEAMLLFAAAGREDRLDSHHWQAAEVAAQTVAQRWHQPDAGIWELDNHLWAHSRLIGAAGLRALAGVAPPAQGAAWVTLADEIVAGVAGQSLHPDGRWQRHPDDPRVDAALVLPALRGAVPVEDPRSRATLAAVEADLVDDGFCYRYRHDDRPLEKAEGAFVLCGFWLALAHHQTGDPTAARRYFERNRTACGPPGLLSEEYDTKQRQMRGNVPQAFAHALLLEAAARLAEPAPALR